MAVVLRGMDDDVTRGIGLLAGYDDVAGDGNGLGTHIEIGVLDLGAAEVDEIERGLHHVEDGGAAFLVEIEIAARLFKLEVQQGAALQIAGTVPVQGDVIRPHGDDEILGAEIELPVDAHVMVDGGEEAAFVLAAGIGEVQRVATHHVAVKEKIDGNVWHAQVLRLIALARRLMKKPRPDNPNPHPPRKIRLRARQKQKYLYIRIESAIIYGLSFMPPPRRWSGSQDSPKTAKNAGKTMNRHFKHTLLASLVVAAMGVCAPVFAQDYLNAPSANRELKPGEVHDKHKGDSPDMFKADPSNTGNDYQSKRLRAIAATDKMMNEWINGDGNEHGHKMTKEQFNNALARAQTGDLASINEVADAYRNGNGTSKNDEQAINWYKAAIDKGEFEAYSKIGDIYRDYGPNYQSGESLTDKMAKLADGGMEVKKDNATALEWYKKGTLAGDPESTMQLGLMYRAGAGGLTQSEEEAARLYNLGLAQRKQLIEERMLEQRKYFYEQAARAEGLEESDSAKPADGQPNDPNAKAVANTTIAGSNCTVTTSTAKQAGYAQVFDAKCPAITAGKPTVDVEISGFLCKVQPISAGSDATHRLLCNPANADLMIGEAKCRLERAATGVAYSALCDREVADSVKTVNHNGLTCDVKAGKAAQSY
ncbi:MAG: sel1 repeat family protein, partial [Alphaproteobacteria bacterium]|nr:sel1 repeat family protein [Alphaproteobacteria bacterium]